MPLALVTGASRGLGRALVDSLAADGWSLVIDGRDAARLEEARRELSRLTSVTAVAGDVARPEHRAALIQQTRSAAAGDGLALIVNNASSLGPSPLPPLSEYPLDALAGVFQVNTVAPLALVQAALPLLRPGAAVVNVSSDAAVEPYPGWGGYGAAKAALDQLTAVLAVELPWLRFYAFDPGDLRTELHQQAFPGEDISDRPEPSTVVPALRLLADGQLASGRYRAADLTSGRADA